MGAFLLRRLWQAPLVLLIVATISFFLMRFAPGGPFDSERATDFWLAPDYDYVMLRMLQREPDGRVISLDVTQATLNGEALRAIEETHMDELTELEEPETR